MMARFAMITTVVLVCVSGVQADTFGTGVNEFALDFVPISGDAGDLGSWPAGTDYTFTGVNRSDYRMGTFEITNDQWDKFKAAYGTVAGDPYSAYYTDPYFTGTNVPTNHVSWYEAAQFVNYLNTSKGYQPAYKFTGRQGMWDYTLGTWSAAEADNGTNLYRHKDAIYYMPTEDEWVKAGYWNGTSLQTYATTDGTVPVAGVDSNFDLAIGEPWDVGSGSEEFNGTFDMMGNVWEWMESPHSDPTYGTGSSRGQRGGSYLYDFTLASSYRGGNNADDELNVLGFRVASEVPEPCSLVLLSVGGLLATRRRR